MIDPLVRWGATSWMEDMQSKVQGMLADQDKDQRAVLHNGAYSIFAQYKGM